MKRYACYRKIHCTFTFLFLKHISKRNDDWLLLQIFFHSHVTVSSICHSTWIFKETLNVFLTGLHTKKLLVKCTQILWMVQNTEITRHLWFLPGFLQNLGMGENNYDKIDCMWSGLSWRNGLQKKWDLKWGKNLYGRVECMR